jgi:hypothetical protein
MAAQQSLGLWSERLAEPHVDSCHYSFADGAIVISANYLLQMQQPGLTFSIYF